MGRRRVLARMVSGAPSISIAIYLPDLSGGGAERLHLGLAPLFASAGYAVTLLLDQRRGALLDAVPAGIEVAVLGAGRQLQALPRLVSYLRTAKPDILVANMEHMNIMALAARALARSRTRIIVCQHNTLSEQAKRASLKFRALPRLYRFFLPMADGIVAVSRGVAEDMAACSGIAAARVTVIYNGAIGSDFEVRMSEAAADPWAGAEPRPTIVAVGRMVPQKDYPTLVRAFAIASRQRELRLLILGEGPQRSELAALCAAEGLRTEGPNAAVRMPGFVANPLPLVARADLLVLASRFEGFGLVLAEALACGTPVVSTDCPHGPAEILEGGRYGVLVPVGDPTALAAAMLSTLSAPPDATALKQRGRSFSLAGCAEGYLDLFRSVLAGGRPHATERAGEASAMGNVSAHGS